MLIPVIDKEDIILKVVKCSVQLRKYNQKATFSFEHVFLVHVLEL